MEKYLPANRLSDIVNDNPLLLMAMSRFGLSLGFGDKSVESVCQEQDIDCPTFLALANFISFSIIDLDSISLRSLMTYLENAHDYFLDFCLPMIRSKLVDALGRAGNNELALLILKFYDDYVGEVHEHMDYEGTEVFAYVKSLLDGKISDKFSIDVFAKHHHSIHNSLKELKNILIQYLPQRGNNLLNAALFDIINCEEDLISHCRVEDQIFVPVVRKLEHEVALRQPLTHTDEKTQASVDDEAISPREREIIECVARGMSNKEIADKLFISVNTVTTHRRNLAQKLSIHSPAGLAIYAVINGIVDIKDLK